MTNTITFRDWEIEAFKNGNKRTFHRALKLQPNSLVPVLKWSFDSNDGRWHAIALNEGARRSFSHIWPEPVEFPFTHSDIDGYVIESHSIQRLGDMTEEDAVAEGFLHGHETHGVEIWNLQSGTMKHSDDQKSTITALHKFKRQWTLDHNCPWLPNLWMWVVEVRPL